ncbi:Zn-dependent protease with chaperone function [Streptomyces sp. TLI_053]|uniref:M56 family metallopeptidase n=1 Tax=Streptomyces sp. TLI_053 TaxID=1855352 RepID=UPI00087A086C|nr:M56 family metallopeptidase [Streptomyces sp. TLI_053]SDT81148.1 Zn-dependent protease with chaperone function [Streptomyces sp. TLI_053]
MTLALLALHLLLVGVLLPRRLAGSARLRARLQARPALGAALWLALMASFGTGLLLAAHHLVAPLGHEPAGLVGLFPHLEPAVAPHVHDRWVPVAAGGAVAAVTAVLAARAAGARRRHRRTLDLVATREPGLRLLVLEDPRPAVYCLPGRRARVVATRGAVDLLDERGLAAAVAHEYGHLRGRHHLVLLAADTFALLLGRLPLARLGRAEVALLLEMAADDAALARVTRAELAGALCALATTGPGPAPAALAAASTGVLARVQRLARPPAAPAPAYRLAALAAPLLPYLLACAPHP